MLQVVARRDGPDFGSSGGFGEDYQDRLARRHLYSDTEEFCDILARRQGFDSKQEYISYLCVVTGSYDLIGFRDRMRLEFDVDHCPVFANLYMTLIDGRYWKAGEE